MSTERASRHSKLEQEIRSILSPLMEMDTSPDGKAHRDTARWVADHLSKLGFTAALKGDSATPLIVAHRPATQASRGHIVMFGHYDVDHIEPGWTTEPLRLVEIDRRWYGLGVADNKGALASRLVSMRYVTEAPAITWIIQGEEESGSGVLREWIRTSGLPQADWYLEENGWSRPDGVQRVLACQPTVDGCRPLDSGIEDRLVASLAAGWPQREIEARFMNKHFVPGGCAFQTAIPHGGRYLGIGTNDGLTRIHAPNESIPIDGAVLHAVSLADFTAAVARGSIHP